MKDASIKRFFDYFTIILFLLLLFAPPLKTTFSPSKIWSEAEKRKLEVFPEVSLNLYDLLSFPQKFESYYNDHFGFRDLLINRYHEEMRLKFGITGSAKVIAGQNGWYFFADKDVLEDFRGMMAHTNDDMERFYQKQLKKKEWLAKRGIPYLYFTAPNKQTIYPEKLPDYFYKAKGQTRWEQLEKYLLENHDERLINLRDPLIAAKKEMRLYDKTDTHWNAFGAFIAYKEVIKHIAPCFPDESFRTDFTFSETMREGQAGDLTSMLNLHSSLKEMRPVLTSDLCAESLDLDFTLDGTDLISRNLVLMKGCKKAHLQALVFRDSFFIALEPFFSENFKKVVYVWGERYDQNILEQMLAYFHPDIVIDEKVERTRLKRW